MKQAGPVLVDDSKENDGIHNCDLFTEQIVHGCTVTTDVSGAWLYLATTVTSFTVALLISAVQVACIGESSSSWLRSRRSTDRAVSDS